MLQGQLIRRRLEVGARLDSIASCKRGKLQPPLNRVDKMLMLTGLVAGQFITRINGLKPLKENHKGGKK
ncbi:hypothetical protein NECAME_01514 [Necator americanus]|uniref:Uncharacterized protein n=1 Tax=Necator americanus TaxID=51031 RepID=W2TV81_NECAM|nr:hypothetical protein NECAME_01514 [Necator americanus]ETN84952.1 hypothetical protein NECAME_01514 [Necator americanus]